MVAVTFWVQDVLCSGLLPGWEVIRALTEPMSDFEVRAISAALQGREPWGSWPLIARIRVEGIQRPGPQACGSLLEAWRRSRVAAKTKGAENLRMATRSPVHHNGHPSTMHGVIAATRGKPPPA